MDASQWVNEEPFELHDVFPGARISRLKRQRGETLFDGLRIVHVAGMTTLPSSILKTIILSAGGTIDSSRKVCIAGEKQFKALQESTRREIIEEEVSEPSSPFWKKN